MCYYFVVLENLVCNILVMDAGISTYYFVITLQTYIFVWVNKWLV